MAQNRPNRLTALHILIYLRQRLLVAIEKNDKGAPTKRLWANLYNGLGGNADGREGSQIKQADKRLNANITLR